MTKNESVFANALPYLTVAVAPLCWAGNIVLARGIIDIIPPVTLAFWRWTIAFLILLPFSWRHARRDWKAVVKHWKLMTILSLFGISGFNTLLYAAVHTITAINGAIVQSSMPAFIIVISLVLFGERISALQGLGVVLCLIGAAFVVLRGDLNAFLNMSYAKGDLLMVVAVILYAFYTALLPKIPAMHPLSFVAYTFGIGVAGLLPFYVWERASCEPLAITGHIVSSVLYVAIFPSIVAFLCWNRGAQLIGPNRTGLFINLIPVFASILAILFLDEILKTHHIAGIVLIFSGMLIFNKYRP